MLQVKFRKVKFLLQVDSISEKTALHQEAYLLFYVKKGMFPWFSTLLEEATSGITNPARPKRHNVFNFENLGKDLINLL